MRSPSPTAASSSANTACFEMASRPTVGSSRISSRRPPRQREHERQLDARAERQRHDPIVRIDAQRRQQAVAVVLVPCRVEPAHERDHLVHASPRLELQVGADVGDLALHRDFVALVIQAEDGDRRRRPWRPCRRSSRSSSSCRIRSARRSRRSRRPAPSCRAARAGRTGRPFPGHGSQPRFRTCLDSRSSSRMDSKSFEQVARAEAGLARFAHGIAHQCARALGLGLAAAIGRGLRRRTCRAPGGDR